MGGVISNSLFSSQWHRVKDIRPMLASDVSVSRHVYRGRASYVFKRRAAPAVHRLDAASYKIIDKLNGDISVGELWERFVVEHDDLAPTQDEWMALLAQLHQADLLVVDRRVPEERLFERRQDHRANERRERYLNPLYLKFSLFDPDKWLDRCIPLGQRMFSREAGLALVLLLTFAAITLFTYGDLLWLDLSDWEFLSNQSVFLVLFLYPILKFFHEFAHALAVKIRGGEVHDVGFSLMVLLPLPYVDASASTIFPDKRDRMLVSAAGILVEVAFAGFGALLWAYTDGVLQSLGLALLMLAGLSTVVFNANPLLKFDGYYLLSDWIEIPNLAARSRRCVIDSVRCFACGISNDVSPTLDRREFVWLHIYGVLSALFRVLLICWIAWVVSEKWFFIGLLLAAFALFTAVFKPLKGFLSALHNDPALRSKRAMSVTLVLPAAILLMFLWVPLPHSSIANGVVWVPEEAVIRVSGDCEVSQIFTEPGATVSAGDNLLICEEFGMVAQRDELVARIDELQARRAGALTHDRSSVQVIDAELVASEAALSSVKERMSEIIIKAPIDGVFDVVATASIERLGFSRGELLGYVIPDDQRTVRFAIEQEWIDSFDNKLKSVSLRIPGPSGEASVYTTEVINRTPKATRVVASAALTTAGGGTLRADTQGDGRLVEEAVFDVELAWPSVENYDVIGSNVSVRLVYAPTPLAIRLKTSLQQALVVRVAS